MILLLFHYDRNVKWGKGGAIWAPELLYTTEHLLILVIMSQTEPIANKLTKY